jgi:ABC-2 type transporter
MACAQAVRAFPKEKAIVSNEIAANMYRTLPYFIGKALSELPLVGLLNGLFGVIVYRLTGLSRQPGKFSRFLLVMGGHGLLSEAMGLLIGAVSPSSDVALALFPAVIVLNVIFDGKNISPENTPRLLSWIPKIGLIRWGFEGLALNEFDGLEFAADGARRGPVAKTGTEALARFGLGGNTVWDVLKAQLMITGACWVLSWLGLTLSKQRFLEMKAPEAEDQNSSYGYASQ